MLHHYTDHLTLADIRTAGVLRAQQQTLHRDLLARDAGIATPPLIWFTINPEFDGTIVSKMLAAGWPMDMVGRLARLSIHDDYPGVMLLEEFSAHAGIERDWWDMVIRTGALARSNWEHWRIVTRDIPATEWTATEVLSGIDGEGFSQWRQT